MLSRKEELKDRVDARRKRLGARLSELKADGRKESIEARASIEKQLKEVEQYLRDGWDNMSESVAAKLNEWLDRS